MKKQFLHEQHNRQDKARKQEYLEELRSTPRKNHIPNQYPSAKSSVGSYSCTIALTIDELAPAVVAALRRLNRTIDIARIKDAIRSQLGSYKATIQMNRLPRGLAAEVLEAANTLLKAVSRSVPGQFYIWHEQAKVKGQTEQCEIPAQFHTWLEKMTPKALQVTTAAPPVL